MTVNLRRGNALFINYSSLSPVVFITTEIVRDSVIYSLSPTTLDVVESVRDLLFLPLYSIQWKVSEEL